MFRTRRARRPWLGPVVLAAIVFPTLAPATASGRAEAGPGSLAATDCGPAQALHRNHFPDRPRIDNRFSPLIPGTQFVLDGFVVGDDHLHHPHRIVTTVTDLTKTVDGVRTLVVFDEDYEDGVLQESEIFFVAQDRDGAIWTLGEYPEEYDSGTLTGAPRSWLSGVAGARAGIAMLEKPRAGTATYLQGLAPDVDFKDCATVYATGEKHVCVPLRCYDRVLEIDEFAPLDPAGGHQRKLYAPGVGVIEVTAASGVDPETLRLIRADPLCKPDFAAIRSRALAQDARGYTVAADVFAGSPHAKDRLDARTRDC